MMSFMFSAFAFLTLFKIAYVAYIKMNKILKIVEENDPEEMAKIHFLIAE